MATYKLIQDIEAEDKILGPFTLKQFIFGMVAAFFTYMSVFFVLKNAAYVLIITVPIGLFCGLFAIPFGRDQPTDIWLVAKFRYWFVPRTRIWNQTGVKELVTITVPKKIERVLTDGLSQTEVKSRLEALANTIDSRGWAVKNVSTYSPQITSGGDVDERLINLSTLPQEVPDENDAIMASDVLDPETSPIAHQMDALVTQSERAHHNQVVNWLNTATQPVATQASNWFMNSAAPARTAQPVATPRAPQPMSSDEAAMSKQLKSKASARAMATNHMASLKPLGSRPAQPAPVHHKATTTPMAAAPAKAVPAPQPISDPAILQLASNDDLDIATLARQAQQAHQSKDGSLSDDGEVIVPLR